MAVKFTQRNTAAGTKGGPGEKVYVIVGSTGKPEKTNESTYKSYTGKNKQTMTESQWAKVKADPTVYPAPGGQTVFKAKRD